MRKFYTLFVMALFVSFMIMNLIGCSEEKHEPVFPTGIGSDPYKDHTTPTPTPDSGLNTTCTGCANPAVTSNGEFRLELTDFARQTGLVTLTYQVCKLGAGPEVKDLSHWVLGLDQLLPYLAEDMTLSDVFVNCSIPHAFGGESCGLVEPDPTTQVAGIKFDNLSLGDGQCQTYMLTLDESGLIEGYQIGQGCVTTATKAGNQHVLDSETDAPGFACVLGPVAEQRPETPAAGGEGCTPGYWKNHPNAWLQTGYATEQSVQSVFTQASAFPEFASVSLLEALSFQGGRGTEGAAQILLRAAVAALLNAGHPGTEYPRRAGSAIISDVNGALGSNSRQAMLNLAQALDDDNNLGCPL